MKRLEVRGTRKRVNAPFYGRHGSRFCKDIECLVEVDMVKFKGVVLELHNKRIIYIIKPNQE